MHKFSSDGALNITAAVAGASGYAGGELLCLLAQHPEVTIGAVTGSSNAGQRLGALQPHLHFLSERVVQSTTPEALVGRDVVFLALQHGASAPLIRQLAPGTVVIDAGADYRLEDPQTWERFYGSEHAGTWAYGLPEIPVGSSEKRRPNRTCSAARSWVPCPPTASGACTVTLRRSNRAWAGRRGSRCRSASPRRSRPCPEASSPPPLRA